MQEPSITLVGGRVLVEGRLEATDITLADGRIAGFDGARGEVVVDVAGALVLPGIVDIHGDAFERQVMPRPNVTFPLDLALADTDRQLVANGITTAFHGLTWSWEPGFRGPEAARAFFIALADGRERLRADTWLHLRHETYNLAGEGEVATTIRGGKVQALAFNDHMAATIKDRSRPAKLARMVERSGLSTEDFMALVDRLWAERASVPASIERLAAAAREAGVPILSHDDATVEDRDWYRSLGARIAEFPVTEAVAASAAAAGDEIVFGAPNVIRGGSHTGCPTASEMVARGTCTILASDYFYPALLQAPFVLARAGIIAFADAWALVSTNPARALGLSDRGRLAPGLRADVLVIDDREAIARPIRLHMRDRAVLM